VMLVGTVLVLAGTRHRAYAALALLALVPVLFWGPVNEHVADTFEKIRESPTATAGSNSLAARYQAWTYRWNGWFLKQPVIGTGVGSVALSVDNEYLLRLCESGILGFALFAWLLFATHRQVRALARARDDPLCRLLSTGTLGAFVGLLIQGIVATSFTTIRTMEPFWFLLGLGAAAMGLTYRARRAVPEAAAAGIPGAPGPREARAGGG